MKRLYNNFSGWGVIWSSPRRYAAALPAEYSWLSFSFGFHCPSSGEDFHIGCCSSRSSEKSWRNKAGEIRIEPRLCLRGQVMRPSWRNSWRDGNKKTIQHVTGYLQQEDDAVNDYSEDEYQEFGKIRYQEKTEEREIQPVELSTRMCWPLFNWSLHWQAGNKNL